MSVNIKTADGIQKVSGNTITIATSTLLGGIKVGNNLSITPDGTLSAAEGVGITSDTAYVALTD